MGCLFVGVAYVCAAPSSINLYSHTTLSFPFLCTHCLLSFWLGLGQDPRRNDTDVAGIVARSIYGQGLLFKKPAIAVFDCFCITLFGPAHRGKEESRLAADGRQGSGCKKQDSLLEALEKICR